MWGCPVPQRKITSVEDQRPEGHLPFSAGVLLILGHMPEYLHKAPHLPVCFGSVSFVNNEHCLPGSWAVGVGGYSRCPSPQQSFPALCVELRGHRGIYPLQLLRVMASNQSDVPRKAFKRRRPGGIPIRGPWDLKDQRLPS